MVRGGGAGGAQAEGESERVVVVPVPTQGSRWISVPGKDGVQLVRLDEVISANAPAVFPGREVLATAIFRITRDAGMDVSRDGGRRHAARGRAGGARTGGGGRRCGCSCRPVPTAASRRG